MRLQCPNCDAEYEVDAAAIPFEGRDVQCSNCGHGWFQSHPDFETDYEAESALYDPPPPLPQGSAAAGAIPKRQLEPDALRILREEVALEEAKRAEDAARAAPPARSDNGLEAELDALVAGSGAQTSFSAQQTTQALTIETEYDNDASARDIEMVLDADENTPNQSAEFAPPAQRIAPRRVARLKGLNDEAAAQNAPISAPQMPAQNAVTQEDVDQKSSDIRADLTATKPRKKSAGRAGFYSIITAAFVAVAGYVLGPDLGAAVPALAGPMESYISGVNNLRDQVQILVPQVIAAAKGAVQFAQDWLIVQGWM